MLRTSHLRPLLLAVPLLALTPADSAPDAIKRAEFAFAADALARGTKPAFLAAMHDSAIVFARAVPTRARAVWGGRPDPQPTDPALRWAPAHVGASADGELGYTYGPWLLTGANGRPLATGQFFTIWARQPDGSYRWVLDNGVEGPLAAAPAALPTPAQVVARPAGSAGPALASFRALDQALTEADPGAYHPRATLLRDGLGVLTEPGAVRAQLRAEGRRQYRSAGGYVARSGDLAYTYGEYRAAAGTERGSYVHLWVADRGGWRLLTAVTNRAPQ